MAKVTQNALPSHSISVTGVRNDANNRGLITVIPPLLLALVIFLMVYTPASHLPVLGDGSFHTYVMEEIADKETMDTGVMVHYPMFYHLFGALTDLFAGTPGIKLVSPLMMALSGLMAYLIGRELTKSMIVGLVSMLLIAFSTKVIWYGAQIYMEPFMVFFILITIYSALLVHKKRNLKSVVLAGLLLGAAISTKQQAIFLLIVIPTFFFIDKIGIKRILVSLCLMALVASGPYAFMRFSTGVFLEVPTTSVINASKNNNILDKILLKTGDYDVPEWSKQLEEESNGSELYEQGSQPYESKHIYIWDMLNPVKFVELNNLHTFSSVSSRSGNPISLFVCGTGFVFLQILLVIGFILSFIYSIRRKEWQIVPVVVVFAWLALFLGSDSERYLLYLPLFMVFMLPLAYKLIWGKIRSTGYLSLSAFLLFITLMSSIFAVQAGFWQQGHVKGLANTQSYTPSIGGIASIKEVGLWIQENSTETEKVYGTSDYEWTYYTHRVVWQDYRIYFLPEDRIDYYLRKVGSIKYLTVRQNQLIPDASWNHLEKYPESFYQKIKCMYTLVYVSSYKDIEVYETTK